MTLGWFFAILLWVGLFATIIGVLVHEARKPYEQKQAEQQQFKQSPAELKAMWKQENAAFREQQQSARKNTDAFQNFKNWCVVLFLFLVMFLVLVICCG